MTIRVVSLVPSTTETVISLAPPQAELVGRTRYCVEPQPLVSGVEVVGGTKDVDVARVVALEPDLVLANREENARSDVESLVAAGLRVDVSFPQTVREGVEHLAHVARLLGVDATDLVHEAAAAVTRFEERRRSVRPLRAFCPIWMSPLMTIHGSTYISDVLDLVGCANVFADRPRRYPLAADLGLRPPVSAPDRDARYPRVSVDELLARAPEIILLPDEPHPFDEEDAAFFRSLPMPASREGRVVHVDGKDLMWFGARTAPGVARLVATLSAFFPAVA
ncbi:MAG: ABC transporter substrate-binding protein [Deltaproteobacteria bacterium]|nr:ABC transporter substrate-binding protein [Deltaproteobacteria bacterium]